jgi:hypothetical protein
MLQGARETYSIGFVSAPDAPRCSAPRKAATPGKAVRLSAPCMNRRQSITALLATPVSITVSSMSLTTTKRQVSGGTNSWPSALTGVGAGQLQAHRVPHPVGWRRVRGPEVDPEVAVPVRRDPLLGPAEARDQVRAGDASAQQPPPEVGEVAAQRPPAQARAGGRLREDPAEEEDLLAGAVAAVGLEHDPAPPARRGPHRPGEQPEGPAGGAGQVRRQVADAHGRLRAAPPPSAGRAGDMLTPGRAGGAADPGRVASPGPGRGPPPAVRAGAGRGRPRTDGTGRRATPRG